MYVITNIETVPISKYLFDSPESHIRNLKKILNEVWAPKLNDFLAYLLFDAQKNLIYLIFVFSLKF
jgi:hypothetical protein